MNAKQVLQALKVWQPVVGLEIHTQLATKSKLFSGSGTLFSASANTQVSSFDVALPGTLPVLNRRCVELALRVALALNCRINLVSEFDRKHYFYADLPAGYQITQYRRAIANDGSLKYLWRSGKDQVHEDEAHITQVQLEQDSGRSLHDDDRGLSFIDLNRAGIGLVEIITAPNFSSGLSAAGFVYELRNLLMAVGACSGDMSQGALRVDANVSLHRPGTPLGVRSELKNMNSLATVRRAVEAEVRRQAGLLAAGQPVVNETRIYDEAADATVALRDKERLQDYRYLPEPNLPPLRLRPQCSPGPCPGPHDPQTVCVECTRRSLPALLPGARRLWLHQTLGLPLAYADAMLLELDFFSFFEEALGAGGHPVDGLDPEPSASARELALEVAFWMTNFCLGQLRKREVESIADGPWTPGDVAELAAMRLQGRLTQAMAKRLIIRQAEGGEPGRLGQVVREEGWTVVSEPAEVRECVRQVVAREKRAIRDIRRGKKVEQARKHLLMQVEQEQDGRMNLEVARRELDSVLEEVK